MIFTANEWDPLKRIVVGDATHANWPIYDPVFRLESQKTLWKKTPVPSGPVPDWIINEANEDLQLLADTLTGLGVDVIRPSAFNFQAHDGMYNYCPRDRLLVYGDNIIDTAMMYPCRDMELQCYHDIIQEAKHFISMPRDRGVILDAANILRLNDTLLMLESSSGNKEAYEWLIDTFVDTKIERCNFYAGVHIDSTIVALRDGLVMLNASRVAMNMLSVDPHTVIVDKHQTDLIRTLEHHSFTVIPLELRHSRTLGGGFHCVTLDLLRQA